MTDRLTVARIDLTQYRHNIETIRKQLASEVKIMAVMKANAYGHGLEQMAKTALQAGVDYIGVVSLGELKRIRYAGISAPVLILNYLDPASMDEAIALGAAITIMDGPAIAAAQRIAAKHQTTVNLHLKIDTGLHRAGCQPDDAVALATIIQTASNLRLEGVFTHFAESEALNPSFTQAQFKIFTSCITALTVAGSKPPLIHCANSAATLAYPAMHLTMVRPGILTYGCNPFPNDHSRYKFVQEHFEPVLTLATQVVFVRTIGSGETVGYNRRWQARRLSTIALLPVGYGDGWRRAPHNAGQVLIHGSFAPIIGTIAMDQTIIDITDIGQVMVGDEVILIGKQDDEVITAADVAKAYGTIDYEVITALSDRIVRQYQS